MEPAEPNSALHRRSGGAVLVLGAGLLAGFLAQGEFAHSSRAGAGFVLVVFGVTFLVSLIHSIRWRVGERSPESGAPEDPEPKPGSEPHRAR